MGAIFGAILGIGYAHALIHIPFIYLNVLAAIIYGAAVGWVAAKAMAWLKVRNATVIRVVTLLSTATGLYVAWVVWVYAILAQSEFYVRTLKLLQSPRALWALMKLINQNGVWSMGRSNELVSGTFLWLVWAGEAVLILAMAWIAARGILKVLFCELCKTWCKPEAPSPLLACTELEPLRQNLEAGNFAHVQAVGLNPPQSPSWYRLDLHVCPGCGQTNTLRVFSVNVSVDKKGNSTTKERLIIKPLLLNAEQRSAYQQVREALSQHEPVIEAEIGASQEAALPE